MLLSLSLSHPYCPWVGTDRKGLEVRRTNLYNVRYFNLIHSSYGAHYQQYSAYFRIDNPHNKNYISLIDTTQVYYDSYWDWKASYRHEYGHPIRIKMYYWHNTIRVTLYLRDAYHYCWSRRISWKWWRYWPRRHFGCNFWWMQYRPAHTRILARNINFNDKMFKGKWIQFRVNAWIYWWAEFGHIYSKPVAY